MPASALTWALRRCFPLEEGQEQLVGPRRLWRRVQPLPQLLPASIRWAGLSNLEDLVELVLLVDGLGPFLKAPEG